MQAPYSLLWIGNRRRLPRWQETFLPQPAAPPTPEIADAAAWRSIPFRRGGLWVPQQILTPPSGVAPRDQQQWLAYTFRLGGFWQVEKFWLQPAPAVVDVAPPNQTPWTAYAYRPGGYWQPQKFWIEPAPAIVDIAPPNQTPWVQYPFRAGGFWQPQRIQGFDLTSVVIVPSPPTPPPPPAVFGGAAPPPRQKRSREIVHLLSRHDHEALLALLALGTIDEEEYAALMAEPPDAVVVRYDA